ncbi:MAG: heme exporter protein CcmB [Pseudomonadota bacterium]
MWAAARIVLWRDVLLAVRRQSEVVTSLFFFILVVTLFPLGVGPDIEMLRIIAPGVVWVAALLASMLALNRMFSGDYVDGSLEQMVLAAQPLPVLVFSKILAHWLVSGLPLVVMAPVLGLQLGMDSDSLRVLVISLLIGTPVLSLIGAVGAALTLGLRGGGVLISLLVLPLYIPVLIFGAGAVEATQAGLGGDSHLYLLGAICVFSLLLGPWASSAALRIAME